MNHTGEGKYMLKVIFPDGSSNFVNEIWSKRNGHGKFTVWYNTTGRPELNFRWTNKSSVKKWVERIEEKYDVKCEIVVDELRR